MRTYASGFKFTTTIPVTKREYISMCEEISEGLNKLYNDEALRVKIVPEPITEGGMLFTWVNAAADDTGYKTMRHAVMTDRGRRCWEHIGATTYETWKVSDDSDILFPARVSCLPCLKTFCGAPAWTLDELCIFKTVFEKYGMKCVKMPQARSLVTPV